MISFRPMRDSEYPAYLDYFITDYATEISANYGLSGTQALARAKQEIANDLPHGINTPGEVMFCVVNRTPEAESVVGYLWYRPDLASRCIHQRFLYLRCTSGKRVRQTGIICAGN
ncbi:hypothetical protein [Rhizobium laguerreae]|uniref:hypothetical protein n=1 Tax=Rhizobium laguerreae TaxID=1076926 RepID=UPI0028C44776|nr:hypothetical protein [Rhizobium laguerreae]